MSGLLTFTNINRIPRQRTWVTRLRPLNPSLDQRQREPDGGFRCLQLVGERIHNQSHTYSPSSDPSVPWQLGRTPTSGGKGRDSDIPLSLPYGQGLYPISKEVTIYRCKGTMWVPLRPNEWERTPGL